QVRTAGVVSLSLASWTDDDLIEYLLATCPDRCASVMSRLRETGDKSELSGNPTLWRLVLEEMIADAELRTIRTAIERALARMLPSAKDREIAGRWCLTILVRDDTMALKTLTKLAKRDEDFDRIRPLRH